MLNWQLITALSGSLFDLPPRTCKESKFKHQWLTGTKEMKLQCHCLHATSIFKAYNFFYRIANFQGMYLKLRWTNSARIFTWYTCSPDLNLTPLAAFLRFCWAQRGSDRNLSLFVRWVWHKNVSHPNHSMWATILSTCYASTESLGVSELNDANIKSFGVPGRISRAVESTNFTTIVFTLPHIMAPKFANQLPVRNVGRTCNGSGNVWNWESRSWCTGTLENTAPHKIRCDNFFKFCIYGDVMRAICVETTQRNAD